MIEEVPHAIDQSLEGVLRIGKIVRSLRDFARPPSESKTGIDLNRAIEATVSLAATEWKYLADIQTNLDPQLPTVQCLPCEMHQVLLSLVVNAAQAIAGKVQNGNSAVKGLIRITTSQAKGWAEIRVIDTGTGIREEHRNKIFEPFFTTKEVGKGTGQGLAIARHIIVDGHGGKIWFETESDTGTTFIIQLPIDGKAGTPLES
jgi:signal transduction histidine kinase